MIFLPKIFLAIFFCLSFFCFAVECYEIATGINFEWGDHLHNMIDHIMYLIVNYIGFNFVSYKFGVKGKGQGN